MDLDGSSIIAGIAVSGVGYVLWRYGRKTSRPPHLLVGICMLIYPYFVPGALLICAIGAALLLLLWAATKLGY
jgi:hypothetical protein